MAYRWGPYYSEERLESVEMDEVLKAGHCVEPCKGMQLWAAATGINNVRMVRRDVERSDAITFA